MITTTSQISLFMAVTVAIGLASVDATAGPHGRSEARASVNRPNAPAGNAVNRNSGNTNVNAGNRVGNKTTVNNNRNVNVNNNRNVNVNSNRDVDINVEGHGRYGYDDHYHPVATAAAVTATVAVTSAVVGSIVHANDLPPSCVQVMRGNAAYMQCGSTWYQPQYQGSSVTYVVVNAP
ncbi:hypothetical protein [Paraburkholderia fungorum]|uniref:hypothetical protein n=1 Tax=Paraburkholderia fungorum TaxID=134537 RepID=UPI0038BD28F6